MSEKKTSNPLMEYLPAHADPTKLIISGGDTGYVEYTQIKTLKGKVNAYVISAPVEPPFGPPTKHDWHGALRHLIVKFAKEPLPEGHGKHKKVVGWMQDWFTANGKQASLTQIEGEVRLIFEELEKFGK